MAAFELSDFSGVRPRATDLRLAIGEAVTSHDVDLERGVLRPRARQHIWASATDPSIPMADAVIPQTLFRFHRNSGDVDFWIYFTNDVDVAPGPVDSDDQRHYYTGDGIPKMFTATSVNDTTPPYPQAADTKYPYTWYYLGVPAPTAAPVIDEDSIVAPSEGSVGLISGVVAETVVLNINSPLGNNDGLSISACGEDGRYAGASVPNIRPQGGTQTLSCLNAGTRVRVTEIVDADHVRVVAAGRTGPIEIMQQFPDSSGWRWDGATPDVHKHTWMTRLNSTAKRKSWMLLPDEVVLEVDNHILRVGDIIRVTGAAAPMSMTVTQEIVTTPVTADHWANFGYRTGTLDTADDFEFVGSVSFAIERDGESIDPAVPATADYEISARSYVYTYVSALGEESAPSDPSPIYTVRDGDPVTIETFAAPPTEHRDIDRIWIYRTNTGSSDTAFQFVGEVAVADIASGFVDEVLDDELGEVLETEGWDVPRSDMHSIVAMPNGMLAGLSGNRVCFSVPGFPHAWPRDYEKPLDSEAVGHEVFGNSLYVTTKGNPYVLTGVHPAQMSSRRVETLQACIDKRSIVSTGDRILYVSREGLISGGYDGFVNISANHYTKEQWTKIVGSDDATDRVIRAWYFNGKYILQALQITNFTTKITNLVFDFRDDKTRLTTFSEPVVAAYADPETAELYYVLHSSEQPSVIGTLPANHRQLLRWDYQHPQTDLTTGFSEGDWKSPQYPTKKPLALSCVRVICRRVPIATLGSPEGVMNAHGQILVTVRGRRYDEWGSGSTPAEDDIVLVGEQAVINGQPGGGGWAGEQRSAPFRIAGSRNVLVDALSFEVHVEGPVELEKIQLGESMDDLFGT